MYRNPLNFIKQLEYAEFENTILCADFPYGQISFSDLSCSLSFVVNTTYSVFKTELEISRALFIYRSIFHVKPTIRKLTVGAIQVAKTFRGYDLCGVFNSIMKIRHVAKSKLLTHTIDDNLYLFTLSEPLSFFSISNKRFDYYDWRAPFLFSFAPVVSTSNGQENSDSVFENIFL